MAALNHAAAHANPPARSTPGRAWRGWFLVFAAFWASFAPAWSAAVPVDDPFDKAPSNRSSAWSTALQYKTAVQYSEEYKAAAQVAAPDYQSSRVRARAQNSHLGFLGDPAKTHQENSAQVARLHQENEVVGGKTVLGRSVGSNSDPASLHKYNYGNANPVRFIDPSGHMSALELKLMNFVIGVTARMGIPGLVAAQALIANADKVSRGAAFVNSLTVSLLARGQSILVSGTRIIDAAGNFIGRFRIDLLAQRTTASNQQVNLMVEGKGVPWYLVGRPGWETFLNQLTRQGQAFSQAVQTEGRAIHERVIVFSSKAPPGLEKAWADVQAKIAPYYNRVFTSQADFEKWLDGL